MPSNWACRLCTAAGRESGPRVRGSGRLNICADCKALWEARGKRWCNRGNGHLVAAAEWSTVANCCKKCRNAADARDTEYNRRHRPPLAVRRAYERDWRVRNPNYYKERHANRKLQTWRGER